MLVKSVLLKCYRCIEEAELTCGRLTALIGSNGVGKSTFLRALELFYEVSPRISAEDFFANDTTTELTVAVRYGNLSSTAQELFQKYVQSGELVVERVFTFENGKITSRYFGSALRHAPFEVVRKGLEIKDRGRTAKEAYDKLRLTATYATLPAWTTLGVVPESLRAWEEANPQACERQRDDGQFFGFAEVGQGYLGRFTRLLFIPAVRDAAGDASESKGSMLTALMDIVVRAALAKKPKYERLLGRSQKLYERMMSPEQLPELAALGDDLSKALRVFVPESEVSLNWRPVGAVQLPPPTAEIKVSEAGYHTAVDRAGHGLQRAFVLTMLQELSRIKVGRGGAESADLPNLVIAIEEPELYQHPTRQRHFATTLARLAEPPNAPATQETQVVYATHSPLFVSMDRVGDLRLFRRVDSGEGRPRSTAVLSTNLDELATLLWRAAGEPEPRYTADTLLPRLRSVMTTGISEGFFADVVVLVEGEDDRAAILGTARILGVNFDSLGISVLQCGGKTSLDRPYIIFSKLGIPAYVVWDGDKESKGTPVADNHRILRMMGYSVIDWPNHIDSKSACFERDLEATVRAEIGDDFYDTTLTACQTEFAIPDRNHAVKNPAVFARMLELAAASGKRSTSLEKIVGSISTLKQG